MTARSPTTSLRDDTPRVLLDGFGRAIAGHCRYEQPKDVEALVQLVEQAKREGLTVTFRGSGRSYGDAALNTRGLVVDTRAMNRILSWDPKTGTLVAEAGVTIEQLWKRVIADGYWPAVVPGTMHVTLGGCVSTNVHGKNNPQLGTFGEHVTALELLTASGEITTCSREQTPELFAAVVGGLGLLGAVIRITLRLQRIDSGRLRVKSVTAPNLRETLARFESLLRRSDYVVGWLDAFSTGNFLGRSQLHAGAALEHPKDESSTSLSVEAQRLPSHLFGLGYDELWRLMQPFANPVGMRAVNALKYHLASLRNGHSYVQSRAAFEFLLDYVPDWRLVYGKSGFIQHQLFVPHEGAEACLTRVLEACQRAKHIPFLAVLKRHRKDEFLLSHSLDGWSLALDFRVDEARRASLWDLTEQLTALVLEVGGKFYLAKDAVLKPEQVARAYGPERVARFLAMKAALDPTGLFGSDLAERVFARSTSDF